MSQVQTSEMTVMIDALAGVDRTAPPLDVRDLHVEFRTRNGIAQAVNGVSLVVREGETLAILGDELGGAHPGVYHCFSYDAAAAREAVAIGFYVSFSGIVTFPNASGVREAAAEVPLDRLLVETDCPFLAPVPHRGRRNEPLYVRDVAAEVARLRGATLEEVAAATTANFARLFGVSP